MTFTAFAFHSNNSEPMNPPPTHNLNRRRFLKLASGAALGVVGVRAGLVYGKPLSCRHCEMDLFRSPSATTNAGKCRNCGADARTGERVLPGETCISKEKLSFSRVPELPFPHPDLKPITTKPCGALSDLQAPRSRLRKTRKPA